ncbi:hypothetical protein Clacol_004049 [Clathrus columnatus]|uniref:Aminopeptidase n=1 Tax=Clathrus columnatus TaxID=1419009 RepID=A0AAV5A6B4_9AGAM|nr:hypothetical protein Clacol_004049 [Clathrus columnatus]
MSETSTPISDSSISKHRLPTNVVPKHYDLLIKTDLKALKFEGITSIQYANHVSIESESSTNVVALENVSYDEDVERTTVTLPQALKQGSSIRLSIKHSRELTNELMGYYFSAYKDEGKERHYSLTQFEATAARRAFPCWDEPMLKATFQIAMISREETVSLSNMPVISEGPVNNASINTDLFHDQDHAKWKYTQFEKTPVMSTYLVAFANGDFKYLESSYTSPLSGETRPLRIYATKDLIDQSQFALDVKAKVLPLYEQAFDIEYALPKLDTLVVHDFDAGAMENWGLITGRTTAFLVDPDRANVETKQIIAVTQSHEVAHMWFGNIATMKWWDNLWLNEGFATLMGEVIILNKVFPEWKVYSSFYNEHTSSALSLDATPSSHPVQVDVPSADEVGQIFDELSYSKAAASTSAFTSINALPMMLKHVPPVLRMLSVYAGEEKFLKGVSIYLKDHLYQNTVAEDLWKGIQQATDIPALMTNWTSKIGHPVLTVEETDDGIRIRQDRYLSTGVAEEEDNQTIWQIPLNILTVNPNGEASVDRQALLPTRETVYQLDIKQLWMLNQGATGFYRVLYPPRHLVKLGEEAARENSVLSAEDRLSLLSDAMTLASSGHATTSSALAFIDRLRSETDYLVWRAIQQSLGELTSTWWEQPEFEDLRDFFRTIVIPVVNKLGYEYPEGESIDISELRTTVIGVAASLGAVEVVQKLKQWFDIYIETGSDKHIPPDLLMSTFATATRFGGKREWEACRKAYTNPPTPWIETCSSIGLCSVRSDELIEETFKFVKTEVQSHNLWRYFDILGCNVKVGRKLFSFFQDNYDDLYKRLDGTFQFGDLVKGVSSLMSTQSDANDLREFFKHKDTSKINLAVDQSLDIIIAKAHWLERSKGDVKTWLDGWKKNNKIAEGL